MPVWLILVGIAGLALAARGKDDDPSTPAEREQRGRLEGARRRSLGVDRLVAAAGRQHATAPRQRAAAGRQHATAPRQRAAAGETLPPGMVLGPTGTPYYPGDDYRPPGWDQMSPDQQEAWLAANT